MKRRCPWCEGSALQRRYHDREWGVPVHDDRRWFEFLILEGAQAGLSWDTILKKREHYRRAFAGFDPRKVARFGSKHLRALMRNPGIVRNRLKIEAAVSNARAFLAVQCEFGSFDRHIWQYSLGQATILFEQYPRMDKLVEVEGPPDAIEKGIAALDMERYRFNADRLTDFVARYEARTSQRAALSDPADTG